MTSFNKKYNLIVKLGHNSCYLCGEQLHLSTATLDHVTPKSKHGTKTELCCRKCNKIKANLELDEFILHIKKIIKYQTKINK
jgi:5-methylcytosine-specific restriction endonuclease McrA